MTLMIIHPLEEFDKNDTNACNWSPERLISGLPIENSRKYNSTSLESVPLVSIGSELDRNVLRSIPESSVDCPLDK